MFYFGMIILSLAKMVCSHNEPIAPDILSNTCSRENDQTNLTMKLDDILNEVRNIKLLNGIETLKARVQQLEMEMEDEKQQINNKFDKEMETHKANILELMSQSVAAAAGVTYVRWGRMECPGNGTRTLYDGLAAGGHYTHAGASPNMLCLPRDPEWAKFDPSLNTVGGLIYGVEYELNAPIANAIFGKSLLNFDVPCTVCESNRKSKIMIPGRVTCYAGWTLEYWGYLMTGHYTHAAQNDYHCVDADPEAVEGGATDQNGYLLFFVEVRCDALRCPPYVNGRELPCVVCTK